MCLGLSKHTVVDWRSFCSKVTDECKNFVDPEDPNVHTQNIERLLKDVKSWVRRPGIRSKYLYQYLGRYLFATAHEPSTLLHHFFVQAAKLYPPQSDRSPTASAELSDSSSETNSDWRCTTVCKIPKLSKRKFCNYCVYNGTFLSGTKLEPWKILLFIVHILDHTWNHKTAIENLDISSTTSVDWRSFCGEVKDSWVTEEEAIGGDGVEVEIDKTLIVRRKYERGRVLSQIWLFGGIERQSKKRFVVPLTGDVGEKRDKATLIPLIQKYILKGSVIYSDCWGAYSTLSTSGYTHHTINHSKNFVDPVNKEIHTQNVEPLWLDIKKWIKRPGIRSAYLYQYLACYLFISTKEKATLLHCFLKEAARLYTPGGSRQVPAGPTLLSDPDKSTDVEGQ
ncbi:hypothetical protein EGW08_012530 [Elysia chlorotica]|uniref:ISXO2-like transposase domain-containing protein n=1 Tax=Elysia chlorotica TaxID=188477 RepID=A0A433TDQ0_ELYCH|nr:hypothetical protein EGW08_012530 [Elysia chlorotica]